MDGLFIVKRVAHDKSLSDEAFTVWVGLRCLMQKDVREYFVTYNMIAYYLFNRVPDRYELVAIKKGMAELIEREYVKPLEYYKNSEFVVDLTALYYEQGQEHFCDICHEEVVTILNLDVGKQSNYKLLRYYTVQVGTFNNSKNMGDRHRGKVGGYGLDYFTEFMNITKPTVILYNEILMENRILFVHKHNDFIQYIGEDGQSRVREIPNTYARYKDAAEALSYIRDINGFKQKNKNKTEANERRRLGQKLRHLRDGVEYDIDTIKDLYLYADTKNKRLERAYKNEIANGYTPKEPEYVDMEIFNKYLLDF